MTLQATVPTHWPPPIFPTGSAPSISAGTQINATGEYIAVVFRAYKAMTISTIAFYVQAVTTAGTVDARVETVATTSKFPSGTLWAANTNIVSGSIAAAGWQTLTLTANATINVGDIVAVKVAWASGDLTLGRVANYTTNALQLNGYHVVNTGADAASSNIPCIAAGDGTEYYFLGQAAPAEGIVTNTFNNTTTAGSGGDERGVRFKLPFAATIAGMTAGLNGSISGNFDILVTDDTGAELNTSATAIDLDQLNGVSAMNALMFDNPVDLSADTWYRVFVRPTSASNISYHSLDLNSAALKTALCGTQNFQHTFRTDGGSPDDTNTTDYPMIGLLLTKFQDGAGGGSAVPCSRPVIAAW